MLIIVVLFITLANLNCLKFQSSFVIYKMVDSEYSTNICKSLNIGIGTVMRNS